MLDKNLAVIIIIFCFSLVCAFQVKKDQIDQDVVKNIGFIKENLFSFESFQMKAQNYC